MKIKNKRAVLKIKERILRSALIWMVKFVSRFAEKRNFSKIVVNHISGELGDLNYMQIEVKHFGNYLEQAEKEVYIVDL